MSCGIALEMGQKVCGACLSDPPDFDGTAAAFCYAFPVDRLVTGLKFHQQLPLLPFFIQSLVASKLPDLDCVVSVPMHNRRLRERGFDHVSLLARGLASRWGYPFDPRILSRRRNDVPQSTLGWNQRKQNVQGAFTASSAVAGMRIAVVDDVMTTGATLRAIAEALKSEGAVSVQNVVVARTPEPHS